MKKYLSASFTLIIGGLFAIVLIESQAVSWYRIQEMFYFKSFHMYGLLGSAIATGALSIFLIKKFNVKSIQHNPIQLKSKPVNWFANGIGGIIFGIGWGLTGACSAPLFINIGFDWKIGILLLTGALLGTYLYALLKNKLPH